MLNFVRRHMKEFLTIFNNKKEHTWMKALHQEQIYFRYNHIKIIF